MKIKDIQVKTIFDSRKAPTVQVTLVSTEGVFEASAPSGKSTGAHEAAVIDPYTADEKLSTIKEKILSEECETIGEFDALLKKLDGTENKNNLGANLILPLSMAWARAQAAEEKIELVSFLRKELVARGVVIPDQIPRPICNVINGGAHSTVKSLDFQEFQVIPTTNDFALALSVDIEYYRKLKAVLQKKFGNEKVTLGDEAGFSCPFSSNEEALEIMEELIISQAYPLKIGLDIAASQLYKDGTYHIEGNSLAPRDLLKKYGHMIHAFPIVSIEDPFYEEDFENFAILTNSLPQAILVITDDLTTTNPTRLETALDKKAGNTILVKPNQIGTISETLDVIGQAYKNNWEVIVSHRSGETMDDFIADLAVGVGAWGMKAGAPGAPERMAKYDRVLQIVQSKK